MLNTDSMPVSPARKPPGGESAGNKGFRPGTRHTRDFMDSAERQLADFWARHDSRDPCRVLARRLGCSQDEIARLIVGLYLQYQREAASLKVGLQSALEMAQEAGAEVWKEAA